MKFALGIIAGSALFYAVMFLWCEIDWRITMRKQRKVKR